MPLASKTLAILIVAALPALHGFPGFPGAGGADRDAAARRAVLAQDRARPGLGLGTEDLAELRRRWESMDEAERARLRERFAALRRLDAGERERVEARARRLDELARALAAGLAPAERAKLEALPPAKRRELLREMVVAEARAMGQRVLGMLPEDERERLEAAGPDERLELLLELRANMNERIAATVERLAPELGFSPAEIEHLRSLSPERRRTKFLEVVQRRALRAVELNGLPEGLPPERWEAAKQLPPDEFYLLLLRLRRQHPGFGTSPGLRPTGPEGRSERGLARLRRSLQLDLDPEERLALADRTRAERQAELRRLQRERALEVLREEELLPPALLERLERAPDRVFFPTLRERLTGRTGSLMERGPRGTGRGERRPDGSGRRLR